MGGNESKPDDDPDKESMSEGKHKDKVEEHHNLPVIRAVPLLQMKMEIIYCLPNIPLEVIDIIVKKNSEKFSRFYQHHQAI